MYYIILCIQQEVHWCAWRDREGREGGRRRLASSARTMRRRRVVALLLRQTIDRYAGGGSPARINHVRMWTRSPPHEARGTATHAINFYGTARGRPAAIDGITTGIRAFAECRWLCRVLFIGHSAKQTLPSAALGNVLRSVKS
jgi:hypothetical protein